MKDSHIVQAAYEETVKNLFSVFYNAFITASTQQEKQQAEQRFKAAVKSARDCRDRALVNL